MALNKDDQRKYDNCRLLGMSHKEALDVIDCDKEIDRGVAQSFDLDPETEKMAKKFANATTKKKAPTAYNWDTSKRERKANPTKGAIIAEVAKFLKEQSENAIENLQVPNAEREITFSIAGVDFTITLTQHRAKKK